MHTNSSTLLSFSIFAFFPLNFIVLWAKTQTLLQQQINPLQAQGYSSKRTDPKGKKVWLITSPPHSDISSTLNRTTPISSLLIQIDDGKTQEDRFYQFKCIITRESPSRHLASVENLIQEALGKKKQNSSMSYSLNQPNYSTIYEKWPIKKEKKRLRPT